MCNNNVLCCTAWKPFIQMGVVNCADSKNSDVCRKYKIMAYPTIKVFVKFFKEIYYVSLFNNSIL